MTTLRLIPVVIAAATALLLLKGISLLGGGGYLLTGVPGAVAAGTQRSDDQGHGQPTTASDSSPSIKLPGRPTIDDQTPTLDDHAPILVGGGGTVDTANGGSLADDHAVPLPLTTDGIGRKVPAVGLEVAPAEAAVLTRLAERRAELDAREADLGMRLALVEAAEKRLAERVGELEALEAQIAALVGQTEAAETAQFKGLVTMYETMKPREAAQILNALEPGVLLPIARGISPRRMAPILAAMDPARAQELTARLAGGEVPTAAAGGGLPGVRHLPQIIGQ